MIPFWNQIIEHYRYQNDNWEKFVETRISCSNNLVADEAIYHKQCLTRFILNWSSFEAHNKGRPFNEIMLKWLEMLCIWLEVEADGELYCELWASISWQSYIKNGWISKWWRCVRYTSSVFQSRLGRQSKSKKYKQKKTLPWDILS